MASRVVVVRGGGGGGGGGGGELILLVNFVIVLPLHMVTKAGSPVIIQKILNC